MANTQGVDSSRAPRPGLWGRLFRSQAQVEADELQHAIDQADDAEVERIDCCTPGDTVTVRGMVRSVTLRPRTTVPALEIELYDGTGTLTVIWLGRRRIPGIDAGRTMVVCGRLTGDADEPTIYNPRYELKPPAA